MKSVYWDDILFIWGPPEMCPSAQKPAVKVACFPPNVRPAPGRASSAVIPLSPFWNMSELRTPMSDNLVVDNLWWNLCPLHNSHPLERFSSGYAQEWYKDDVRFGMVWSVQSSLPKAYPTVLISETSPHFPAQ